MPITSRFVIQTASAFLTVGFLALFLIVGMTNWLSNRAQNFTDALAVHTDLRNQAMALRDALRTAESSERGFLLTGNEIYLAPYETARAQVNRNLAGVVAHLQDDPAAAKMRARLVTVITRSSRWSAKRGWLQDRRARGRSRRHSAHQPRQGSDG